MRSSHKGRSFLQALLEAAVGYILAALQQPLCAPSAASALRFLCSNAQQERAASLFAALLPAVAPVLESTGKASDSKTRPASKFHHSQCHGRGNPPGSCDSCSSLIPLITPTFAAGL